MLSKESWNLLPQPEKDRMLLELAWMMLGETIQVIPRRDFSPEEMKAAHEVVNDTSARYYSWAASSLGAVTLLAAAAVLLSDMGWAVRIPVILALLVAAIVARRNLFPVSLAKAAHASPVAFVQLWRSGAIRLEVRGEQYDEAAFAAPNRWQDVVLLAAGWTEYMQGQPESRGQRLAMFSALRT